MWTCLASKRLLATRLGGDGLVRRHRELPTGVLRAAGEGPLAELSEVHQGVGSIHVLRLCGARAGQRIPYLFTSGNHDWLGPKPCGVGCGGSWRACQRARASCRRSGGGRCLRFLLFWASARSLHQLNMAQHGQPS